LKNSLVSPLDKFTKNLAGQIFVALLLGSIQVFSFAPFEQWWTLYPSFVGFFLLLQQVNKTNKKSFIVSFAFNLAMFLATIHWIYVSMDLFGGMPTIVSILLILLLCAYLAIFPTLAIWATTRLTFLSTAQRYLLIMPVFWLLMDWFRGWFLTGFPWAYLGYSHADTPLVGFAPVLGVQGITLAILLISSALTLIIQKHKVIANLTLICVLIISGYFLQKERYTEPQPAINVALVQGNIDQNKKWEAKQLYPSLFKYLDLSEAGDNSDRENELIIWPESAIAALEIDMQRFLQPLSKELEMKGKTLMTGIIEYKKGEYDINDGEYRNAIIMLGKLPKGAAYSQKSTNRYRKHQLLPIGEFVPFEDLLRPIAPYFNLPMSSFQRGEEVQSNLQSGLTTFAPALCYEVAFPELLRKNVTTNTGMLLTLSNDAWFGSSIGPDQHLQIARMRAIEFARPILRSTNNGITAIYDDQGVELGRLASNTEGVLRREVQPTFGLTPYQRVGSIPLYLYCMLVLIGMFVLYLRREK
jgi:apolipoprotein N-acyltransferase